LSTELLIERCQKNDYKAQMQVYNNYKHMMYGAAVRIVKSREEAEDIVQDCFIKGFQKIHQLERDANLGGWLKRIVINKALDLVKEKQKIVWAEETSIVEEQEEEIKNEVQEQLKVEEVKSCLEKLKEKYRIVLTLYLIENYNHREIGEILKLKESTVRNQFRRGKNQLLTLIQNIQR